MDFLFNLVANCKKSDYEIDARWSFRNYFSKPEKGTLSEKWKQVRHTFLRLKDMYDDIYCYHYIGFLTYNSNDNTLNSTSDLLSREATHSEFVDELRQDIKSILTKRHDKIEDYTYDQSKKKDLRLLFVMHNVETILQKYASLHDNDQLKLRTSFERFPFELLHRQKWDIEHQTLMLILKPQKTETRGWRALKPIWKKNILPYRFKTWKPAILGQRRKRTLMFCIRLLCVSVIKIFQTA